jgi:GT2 family glycosyltransferase
MQHPLVSIITINYDQPEVTCELLDSLRKLSYPNFEVIVVDNASPTRDPSIIRERHPEVIFLQSDENLGFAGGNNLASRQAKGKYLLYLNNDTEVNPGFLEPLVAKCESDPKTGAVSPKIRYFSKPDTIQFAGQAPINPYTIRSYGYAWGQKDNGQFDHDAKTCFVHGAAMMIPRSVIEKTGLMAEIYFLYYEELDWGARIRSAGYDLWYVHDSLVFHKESISTGKVSPFKTYYMNRARLIYLRRNVKGLTFIIALLFQIFFAIPKNIAVFSLKRQFAHLKSYLKAISWQLKNISGQRIHHNPAL